jgi:flagellar motor switch protein FliG
MDKMFAFDDVMKLDDKAIQMVLKEVASDALIVALKGAQPELKEKFLANMSSRAAETLREVASETLIVALKGAVPELREKFLSNMSTRAAEALREDLESRGPMRLSEVEAQQKEILKTVRRLSDEGQIVIGGGGDDAFV